MRTARNQSRNSRGSFKAALVATSLFASASAFAAQPGDASSSTEAQAKAKLEATFSNLSFESFELSPLRGPVYQALVGGRIVYFAPDSQHLVFGAIYSKDGDNITATVQDRAARARMSALDTSSALVLGPSDAPTVVEFTDPDCPYCHALHKFWAQKASEGRRVRRLAVFVTAIHPRAGAKAQHILCSPDPAAEFDRLYAGEEPSALRTCAKGAEQVAAHTRLVGGAGVTGTPTVIAGDQVISGFRQPDLEAFISKSKGELSARR